MLNHVRLLCLGVLDDADEEVAPRPSPRAGNFDEVARIYLLQATHQPTRGRIENAAALEGELVAHAILVGEFRIVRVYAINAENPDRTDLSGFVELEKLAFDGLRDHFVND